MNSRFIQKVKFINSNRTNLSDSGTTSKASTPGSGSIASNGLLGIDSATQDGRRSPNPTSRPPSGTIAIPRNVIGTLSQSAELERDMERQRKEDLSRREAELRRREEEIKRQQAEVTELKRRRQAEAEAKRRKEAEEEARGGTLPNPRVQPPRGTTPIPRNVIGALSQSATSSPSYPTTSPHRIEEPESTQHWDFSYPQNLMNPQRSSVNTKNGMASATQPVSRPIAPTLSPIPLPPTPAFSSLQWFKADDDLQFDDLRDNGRMTAHELEEEKARRELRRREAKKQWEELRRQAPDAEETKRQWRAGWPNVFNDRHHGQLDNERSTLVDEKVVTQVENTEQAEDDPAQRIGMVASTSPNSGLTTPRTSLEEIERTTAASNGVETIDQQDEAGLQQQDESVISTPPTGSKEPETPPDEGNSSLYSLEILMKNYTPADLSGRVSIPDRGCPAQGGLADVHAGILDSQPVRSKSDIKLYIKIFSGCCQDTTNSQKPQSRPKFGSIQSTSELRVGFTGSNSNRSQRITREMHVWAALKHQNICEFLGYSTGFSDYPAMVSTVCYYHYISYYSDRAYTVVPSWDSSRVSR